MLTYEKLLVYQCSIRFLKYTTVLLERIPRGHSGLGDQLKRASISISLNIAEATGKTRDADKQRFFAIARGSAMECASILEICFLFRVISESEYRENKSLLTSIVAMLSKLSHSNSVGFKRNSNEQEQEQEQA